MTTINYPNLHDYDGQSHSCHFLNPNDLLFEAKGLSNPMDYVPMRVWDSMYAGLRTKKPAAHLLNRLLGKPFYVREFSYPEGSRHPSIVLPKLRTMGTNAEAKEHLVASGIEAGLITPSNTGNAAANDSRVRFPKTLFNFIRDKHWDELPQLLLSQVGALHAVGPRPYNPVTARSIDACMSGTTSVYDAILQEHPYQRFGLVGLQYCGRGTNTIEAAENYLADLQSINGDRDGFIELQKKWLQGYVQGSSFWSDNQKSGTKRAA